MELIYKSWSGNRQRRHAFTPRKSGKCPQVSTLHYRRAEFEQFFQDLEANRQAYVDSLSRLRKNGNLGTFDARLLHIGPSWVWSRHFDHPRETQGTDLEGLQHLVEHIHESLEKLYAKAPGRTLVHTTHPSNCERILPHHDRQDNLPRRSGSFQRRARIPRPQLGLQDTLPR